MVAEAVCQYIRPVRTDAMQNPYIVSSALTTGTRSMNAINARKIASGRRKQLRWRKDLNKLHRQDVTLTVFHTHDELVAQEDGELFQYHPDAFPLLLVRVCDHRLEDRFILRAVRAKLNTIECNDVRFVSLLLDENSPFDALRRVADQLTANGAAYVEEEPQADTDEPVEWSISQPPGEYPSPHYDYFIYLLSVDNLRS